MKNLQSQSLLLQLPKDRWQNEIKDFLGDKSLASSTETCSWLYNNLFQPLASRKRKVLEQLLKYVVDGDEEKAKEMIEKYPQFLSLKDARVIDASGREIKDLTPFQATLCAGDVEMCKMMKSYFEKLDGGLNKMRSQFDEIFPGGVDAHYTNLQKEAYNFDWIFEKFGNAYEVQATNLLRSQDASFTRTDKFKEIDTKDLTSEQRNELTLLETLNRFRKEFVEHSKKDKVFNPYHLLKAYHHYTHRVEGKKASQRDLFWCQVIGFTQRFLPACYRQAFSQGLTQVVKSKSLIRDFEFAFEGGTFTIAEGADALGLGWAVADRRGMALVGICGGAFSGEHLEIYLEQKAAGLRELMAAENQSSNSLKV